MYYLTNSRPTREKTNAQNEQEQIFHFSITKLNLNKYFDLKNNDVVLLISTGAQVRLQWFNILDDTDSISALFFSFLLF